MTMETNTKSEAKFIDKNEQLLAAKYLTMVSMRTLDMTLGNSISSMYDEINNSRKDIDPMWTMNKELERWIIYVEQGDPYCYRIWNDDRTSFQEIQEIDSIHEYQLSH